MEPRQSCVCLFPCQRQPGLEKTSFSQYSNFNDQTCFGSEFGQNWAPQSAGLTLPSAPSCLCAMIKVRHAPCRELGIHRQAQTGKHYPPEENSCQYLSVDRPSVPHASMHVTSCGAGPLETAPPHTHTFANITSFSRVNKFSSIGLWT